MIIISLWMNFTGVSPRVPPQLLTAVMVTLKRINGTSILHMDPRRKPLSNFPTTITAMIADSA